MEIENEKNIIESRVDNVEKIGNLIIDTIDNIPSSLVSELRTIDIVAALSALLVYHAQKMHIEKPHFLMNISNQWEQLQEFKQK